MPPDSPGAGALWIDGVSADGGPSLTIDGATGLELLAATRASATLAHPESGLHLMLEYGAAPGNAIVHRLALVNRRQRGAIRIGAASTLSLPLLAGDLTEVLSVADTEQGWSTITRELPISYGHHGLRSGDSGVYPMLRLATHDGHGILVAVSTATAWRIDVGLEDQLRSLRAGEYRSDLTLLPGEEARLPEVVTIFYSGGEAGAIGSLRRYLESIAPPRPQGWRSTPPVVFNTWFGYGCGLVDDGSKDTRLRRAARAAAESGVEVLVVDAGWYVGNPLPEADGDRRRGKHRDDESHENAKPDESEHSLLFQGVPDDFNIGLGAWVENPQKWQAKPGEGGSSAAGLRNFSDYVRGLNVRRSDGRGSDKLRFGLWFEPERFDRDFEHPKRVPSDWAIPDTPLLDFSRPEVVDAIGGRLQYAIDAYGVDYIKIDANYGYWPESTGGPTGHFWTDWSAGFERLLDNLRHSNPELYIEHCAGGLKRYWIGMAARAHSSWLDDDVQVDNVRRLLDATDALLLPRQKTVLVTEEFAPRRSNDDEGLPDPPAIGDVLREYWGADQRNGGTIGFSSRLDRWSREQQNAAAEALNAWKRDIR